MKNRRGRSIFLVVLLAGLSLFTGVWYLADRDTKGSTPIFGGSYVEGLAGAPARINPLFAGQNAVDQTIVSLVFAGLTRLDNHGQAFPDLAETWTVSSDGRSFSIRLRQGLVWQDGVELTADDVLFTYGLLRTPGLRSPPPLSRILAGANLTRVDSRNLTIELSQPYAALPSFLTLGILPQHLLTGVSTAALFDASFNQRPVGAGPYRLEELTGDRAVLVANPAFHLGQPFVQRLELRFYRDEGGLLAALKAKEVIAAYFSDGVGATDLVYLEQHLGLQLQSLGENETTFVFLNLRLPLFQDRRVRQALLFALDRDAIAREIFGDIVRKADSPIVPDSWAYTDALRRYTYDPRVAEMLLDEAGWRRTGSGIRAKDNVELGFKLSVNNDPLRLAVAQEVARRWSAVGMRVTVDAVGATSLVRDLLEPHLYDAAVFAQVGEGDPDPYPNWHSSQTGATGGNLASYNDGRVDRILEEARLTATLPRRKELYANFQELFAQEVPALPLYVSTALYVQKPSLRGVRVGYLDNPGSRFWQVQEWYLKTR